MPKEENVKPPAAGAHPNQKARNVAKAMLEAFGHLVIPINPATVVGKLAGRVTDTYGDKPTGMRFRYTRRATQKEWDDVAYFLLRNGVIVPPVPIDWEPWVLEDASLPPKAAKG
jgi:hypothetical protein